MDIQGRVLGPIVGQLTEQYYTSPVRNYDNGEGWQQIFIRPATTLVFIAASALSLSEVIVRVALAILTLPGLFSADYRSFYDQQFSPININSNLFESFSIAGDLFCSAFDQLAVPGSFINQKTHVEQEMKKANNGSEGASLDGGSPPADGTLPVQSSAQQGSGVGGTAASERSQTPTRLLRPNPQPHQDRAAVASLDGVSPPADETLSAQLSVQQGSGAIVGAASEPSQTRIRSRTLSLPNAQLHQDRAAVASLPLERVRANSLLNKKELHQIEGTLPPLAIPQDDCDVSSVGRSSSVHSVDSQETSTHQNDQELVSHDLSSRWHSGRGTQLSLVMSVVAAAGFVFALYNGSLGQLTIRR